MATAHLEFGTPPMVQLHLGAPRISETMTIDATTASTASAASGIAGGEAICVTTDADAWIAIGANPNAATAGARRKLIAGVRREFWINGGEKVALRTVA